MSAVCTGLMIAGITIRLNLIQVWSASTLTLMGEHSKFSFFLAFNSLLGIYENLHTCREIEPYMEPFSLSGLCTLACEIENAFCHRAGSFSGAVNR